MTTASGSVGLVDLDQLRGVGTVEPGYLYGAHSDHLTFPGDRRTRRGPASPRVPTRRLTDVQIRPPVDDEVLVRIDAVGICHTDVSVAARWPARKLPMVFGHEGVGTIVESGPRARAEAGQQVVLTFASCGRCANCSAGTAGLLRRLDEPQHAWRSAPTRRSALRLDGDAIRGGFFGQSSFATHALARPANTVVLTEPMDPVLAAPLGCSVQTGVGTVLNVLAVGGDDGLVVFGAGAVGLSAVMGARIAGCRTIVAVDPVAERRCVGNGSGCDGDDRPDEPTTSRRSWLI